MEFLLSEILTLPTRPVKYIGGKDELLNKSVKQFVIDSRKVVPESVFVAIRGEKLDGHQFAAEALTKGALAAVVDQAGFEVLKDKIENANLFVVPDTLLALQEIANMYRGKFNFPVLGITGTSGKTTTKEMMGTVLSSRFRLLKTEGNLNNHIGVPMTLLQLQPEHEFALIEMGTNHFGEIKRLAEIAEPDFGLITNIGRGHLEFFGSVEGVAKAKMELFQGLRANGTAFVNVDDPLIVKNLPKLHRTITFGIKNDAQIKAESIHLDQLGKAKFKVFDQEISLPIPGLHNVYNALAALSAGLEFGLSVSEMKPLIQNFQPHSKRMEIIIVKGFTIINDCYNANPDSTSAALSVLESMEVSGRKVAVLGDMLELGTVTEQEHRLIGRLVGCSKIDYFFGFGPHIKLAIEEALNTSKINASHFEDKNELVMVLKGILKKGDVVLIKGSRGMAMETVLQAITDESK